MASLLRIPNTTPVALPNGSKTTSHGVNREKFNCNLGRKIETKNVQRVNQAIVVGGAVCRYALWSCLRVIRANYFG